VTRTLVLCVSLGACASSAPRPARPPTQPAGPLPAAEPPPEGSYALVNNSVVGAQRIAGPDYIALQEHGDPFRARGRFAPVFMFKICVGVDGAVSSVTQMGKRNPSGTFDVVSADETPVELDRHFRVEFSRWRFRPFVIDGKPTVVCTPQMFKYRLDP
jgi:hypothetical protein